MKHIESLVIYVLDHLPPPPLTRSRLEAAIHGPLRPEDRMPEPLDPLLEKVKALRTKIAFLDNAPAVLLWNIAIDENPVDEVQTGFIRNLWIGQGVMPIATSPHEAGRIHNVIEWGDAQGNLLREQKVSDYEEIPIDIGQVATWVSPPIQQAFRDFAQIKAETNKEP